MDGTIGRPQPRSVTRIARPQTLFELGRATLAAAALAASGLATAGDAPEPVYGVSMPSGSSVTTGLGPSLSAGPDDLDVDDYVVLVERGRTLTATVVARSRVRSKMRVELVRSDGSVAATAVRSGNTFLIRSTADATDRYRVRVRDTEADPLTYSTYSVAVSVTGRLGVRDHAVSPDAEGSFRFDVAARGGAKITARLAFQGTAPLARGLLAPDGTSVPGSVDAFRRRKGELRMTSFRLPAGLPFGDYVVGFDMDPSGPATNTSFSAQVELPRAAPRRGTLATSEPWIGDLVPAIGAEGTRFVATTQFIEAPRKGSPFSVRIDGVEVAAAFEDPKLRTKLSVIVPAGIAPGVHDVVLTTATGQVAALLDAFTIVAKPVATSFEPAAVPATGGDVVTIRGTGFRPGRTGIRIGGTAAPVSPTSSTATSVTFVAPPRDGGSYVVGVHDLDTGAASDVTPDALTWAPWALVTSVSPPIVSVLGGETVSADGVLFTEDDRVFLEDANGDFEEIAGTYRTTTHREFTAPPRPKGVYALVVETPDAHRSQRDLTYFSYSDVSSTLGLLAGAPVDASSTALADFDGDGDQDLFITRRGAGAAAPVSQTRVLRNGGATGLVDVTLTVFPAAGAADDWRGDRIHAVDVTLDGRPDVVLGTNDPDVPAGGKSHVRILVNEARGGDGPSAADRVYRDRTSDVMAPARAMTPFPYGSAGSRNEVDDWRALDLWVGDLDGGSVATAEGARAEIVATTDRTFENNYVTCAPYCASPYSTGYAYSAYWSGTRVFKWDPAARNGLGRFAYVPDRLPRKVGVVVPTFNPPPGVSVPSCQPDECQGKFTPFTGRRVAAGRIDADAALDIAVLSDTAPTVSGAPVSALQIALSRTSATTPGRYLPPLDATPAVTSLGLDLRGDALAIGGHAWPGGAGGALVAAAKSVQETGPALRLLRYVPHSDTAMLGTFEDLTTAVLPAVFDGEAWQADAVRFVDVNGDAHEDLALLSRAVPAGTPSGLRILRNVARTGGGREFVAYVASLLADASAEPFVGEALTIGDLDGNGLADFVISRPAAPGPAPATRVLATDR